MQERLEALALAADRIALGACSAGSLVAWIDVGVVNHLQSGAFGEIGGFVVASGYRGSGIGSHLLAAAEQWIASRGVPTVVVRSSMMRERAHSFYLREGYKLKKTSAVFSKELAAGV
jgi:GNAT superfamily N-acetyltransferase